MPVSHKRTLVKTVSWRIIATISTIVIVFAFTGKISLSLGIGAVSIIVNFALYYAHERFWDKIKWGKT